MNIKTFFIIFFMLITLQFSLTHITGCQKITTAGDYILDNDITVNQSTCFEFATENVHFNCNGHIIDNTNNVSSTTHIFEVWGTNITIANCEVYNPDFFIYNTGGISHLLTENITIKNNAFSDRIFYLNRGGSNSIFNNITVINATSISYVFYMYNWNTFNITNCHLEDVGGAFYDENGHDYKLLNNTFINAVSINLHSVCENTEVAYNNLTGYTDIVSGCVDSTIHDNNFQINSGRAIYLLGARNNTIYNNIINDTNTYTLFLYASDHNLIYNNAFYGYMPYSYNETNEFNTTYDCSQQSILGGPCIGGNYYDDYTGSDDGSGSAPYHNIKGDAIGDNPENYSIGGGYSYDYLPLTIPEDSVRITNPEDNTGTNITPYTLTYHLTTSIPRNCTTYVFNEDKTANRSYTHERNESGDYNETVDLYLGKNYLNTTCDYFSDEIVFYYDNSSPNITSISVQHYDNPSEHFVVYCTVDENQSPIDYVEINFNGSITNATGNTEDNRTFNATYFQEGCIGCNYNVSCYVRNRANLTDNKSQIYTYTIENGSNLPLEDYEFSGVNIIILNPKNQTIIPWKLYNLRFKFDTVYGYNHSYKCEVYLVYDFDYTTKKKVFYKSGRITSQNDIVSIPIPTQYSFLDLAGYYHKDNPAQQQVYLICGFTDNYHADMVNLNYFVNYPSNFSLILLTIFVVLVVLSVVALLYSDYGIIVSLILIGFEFVSLFTFSRDGVLGSWLVNDVLIAGYLTSSIVFLLSLIKIAFENEKDMEREL